MSKPGPVELFDSEPISVDEWVKHTKDALDVFAINMHNLNVCEHTMFEWFYTFGFWNEALEFVDDFPKCGLTIKEI